MTKKRNKTAIIDYSVLESYDNTERLYYSLTKRQAMALISQADFIGWRTRWVNRPQSFDIASWRDDIIDRLMTPEMIVLDCNELENCLLSSPTIINLQSQISTNAGDIFTLASDLYANSVAIDSLQSQIDSNGVDIANHETRITTLENQTPATGDSGAFELIASETLSVDGKFTPFDVEGYSTLFIQVTGALDNPSYYVGVDVQIDTETAHVGTIANAYVANNLNRYDTIELHCNNLCDDKLTEFFWKRLFNDVSGNVSHTIGVAKFATAIGGGMFSIIPQQDRNWIAGSHILAYGISCDEGTETEFISPITVNFDDGWGDYTPNQPSGLPNQFEYEVLPQGNTGNCLVDNMTGELMFGTVRIDFPVPVTINSVSIDWLVSPAEPSPEPAGGRFVQFYVGGSLNGGSEQNLSQPSAIQPGIYDYWSTENLDGVYMDSTKIVDSIYVRIKVFSYDGNNDPHTENWETRLDNIVIDFVEA